MEEQTTAACLNCGTPLSGSFCHECGQKDIPKRLSWKELRTDLIGKLFGMERGFGKTFIDLTLRPGETLRGYLSGKRKNYQAPIQYYLIATTLLFLLYQYLGFMGALQDGSFNANIQGVDKIDEKQKEMIQLLKPALEHLRLILSLVPPVLALVYKWFFSKKTGYHYIEHLAFALFAVGHTSFLSLPVVLLMKWFNNTTLLFSAAISFIYTYWAIKDFYRISWWKSIIVYNIGYVLFLLVLISCMLAYLIVVKSPF